MHATFNYKIYANSSKAYKFTSKKSESKKIYLAQFVISILIACICLAVFIYHIFKINQGEAIAQELEQQYQASTLYANSLDYTAEELTSDSDLFVIGVIKIDKINLNYPILYETTEELLDISVCRFAGSMPNEVGNLCIAGHNYINGSLFGRLDELEENDIIEIYDLSGSVKEYTVFNIYETTATDTTCTSQETDGETILTLLTCNNISSKRLVVVAKAK